MNEDSTETLTNTRYNYSQHISSHYTKHSGSSSDVYASVWRLLAWAGGLSIAFLIYMYLPETTANAPAFALYSARILMYLLIPVSFFLAFQGLFIAMRTRSGSIPRFGPFLSGLIRKYETRLAIAFACFAVSFAMRILIVPSPEAAAAAPEAAEPTSIHDYINTIISLDIASILMGISSAIAVVLIKNIFIYSLNYNMHTTYYSDRIADNTVRLAMMQRLAAYVQVEPIEDVDTLAAKLVEVLGHGEGVPFHALMPVLGEERAANLFDVVGASTDRLASFDELKHFFTTTLSDERHLLNSLNQSTSSVDALDSVCTFLCIPLAVIAFISQFSRESSSGYFTFLAGGLLSGGYIFSDTIKGILGSIIFVFFVRPFEVNDLVMLNGTLYKVKAINIMSSVLLNNKLVVIYPNNVLLGTPITNYRCSKACEREYPLSAPADRFRALKEPLRERLNALTAAQPRVFCGRPYFRNTRLVDGTRIDTSLVMCFSYENRSRRNIQESQEDFVLELQGILAEVGLVQ